MPSPTKVPKRLADAEGELPEEIVKAINAFERATGVLSSDSRDYSKLRVAPWDAARAALTATILARLTAAESAREALKAEIRDQAMKQIASDAGWELDWDKVRAERDAALAHPATAEETSAD